MVRMSVRTTPLTCDSQASETMMIRINRSIDSDARHREAAQIRPLQDFEPAVAVFDQRRAALNPVAVVAVENRADLSNFGLVDMAADHAVDPARAGLLGQRQLEIVDVSPRVLDLPLQIGRERPVGIAEPAAPQ